METNILGKNVQPINTGKLDIEKIVKLAIESNEKIFTKQQVLSDLAERGVISKEKNFLQDLKNQYLLSRLKNGIRFGSHLYFLENYSVQLDSSDKDKFSWKIQMNYQDSM